MDIQPETREALDAAAKAAIALRRFWGPYWNDFDANAAVAAEAHYAACVVEYVRCRRVNEGEVDESVVLGEIQVRIAALSTSEITEAGIDAFWATIAAAHPGASGDFAPELVTEMQDFLTNMVDLWVMWNVTGSSE